MPVPSSRLSQPKKFLEAIKLGRVTLPTRNYSVLPDPLSIYSATKSVRVNVCPANVQEPGDVLTVSVVIDTKLAQVPANGTNLSGNYRINCVLGPMVRRGCIDTIRSEEDRIVSGEAVKFTIRPVPGLGVNVGPLYVLATLLLLTSLISTFSLSVAFA